MASFEKQAAANRRRTGVLLVFLFALTWAVASVAALWLGVGGATVTMIAAAVSIASVWVSYWKSDKIVLTITRARVVSQEEAPQLHNIVEEVVIASGMPKPRIAIVEDAAPNAFATGRNPENSVIAFTTGILALMNREELQGVAAHELAHVSNRDTLVMSVAATTAGIIALISDLTWRMAAFGGSDRRKDSHPFLLVAALVAALLAPLAAALLRSSVSRSRERLADATAVAYTRNPAGLRSALEKLAGDSTVVRARSNATAHLWIESPLNGKGLSKLFSTHPPIEERIAALRLLESSEPR
jgi:heat shock protein HtpX